MHHLPMNPISVGLNNEVMFAFHILNSFSDLCKLFDISEIQRIESCGKVALEGRRFGNRLPFNAHTR